MADDPGDALSGIRERGKTVARQRRVGTLEHDYQTGKESWTDEIFRICEVDPTVEPNIDLLLRHLHADDRDAIARARAMAIETGQPFEMHARIVVRSGREKKLRITGQVILEGGQPSRLLATIQDVTDDERAEVEIAHRARQQSVLAHVGQIALSNATLGYMFTQATESVRAILDVDLSSIWKREEEDLLLVSGAGWADALPGAATVEAGRGSYAGYALASREPVVVDDFTTETRFTIPCIITDNAVSSGVAVGIEAGEERPWGVIAAYSRDRREFSAPDVDFLRALAATVGQAIERRRAEVELRVRAVQQSAIAEIGRRVLTSDIDQATLERACELVMSGLGVEFAQYLQTDDNGKTLRFRAGAVWFVPPDPIPAGKSQAGHALATGEAVTIADYRTETRFWPELFVPYGIRTGIAVPIVGPTQKFGALTAQTRSKKQFSTADVFFMESLAAVLADALTRELAKRALIESEARYRDVVEGASEIIFSISTEGRIISLNRAFEAITGWRIDEWIGQRFDELIVPQYLAEILDLFESIPREPRTVHLEAHIRGKHRGEILVAATVSPKVVRGDVVELYGFARDVTEERRLEVERNRVTRQLTLILESTDEGIYATDVNGRCTLVNRSAAKLLGASPDELLGNDMHALVHPKSPDAAPEQTEECALLGVMVKAQSHSSRDDIFCRADGTPFPVEYTASPIVDDGVVAGTVVAFNDLSARRKLESKLEQANRLSSLGRLAATVAHEFNNVLMGISPFADVLKREAVSERGQVAVDQISRSVKRGKRITEDILRFTQPSEPVLAVFDAAAWIHTMALEARSLIGQRYTVDVDTPQDPLWVVGDAGQLHQSLINLILNARDAMPGGGRIGVRVSRGSASRQFEFGAIEEPEAYAHFVVEDEGHGMSPETLRHIFEPLFTTKKNGTGLGLAVARHVITRHGGEIFVESTLNVGTKFHLFIPLAPETRTAAALPSETKHDVPRKYKRVLVVEDERAVAAGISSLLQIEGVEAKVVETGREVLPAIDDWRPDAIVLDIGLPDIDGVRVYAQIAHEYPMMPVVFSSGHGDEAQLEVHLARPHVAFLLKPYDIDTLLSTLDRVVS